MSLAWLALIYAIPFAGVGFCVLFGEIRLGRKRAERAQAMYRPYAIWIRQLARLFPQHCCEVGEQGPSAPRPYPGTAGHAHALRQPDDAAAQARHHHPGDSARHPGLLPILLPGVLHLASRRGRGRGVRGADGGGGTRRGLSCVARFCRQQDLLPPHWPNTLGAAGVKVVEVLPVGAWRIPFQRQDLRMHRKLVVIDDRVGYTGSMNMVDPRFFKQDAGVGQWVDIMIRVQGPVVPLMGPPSSGTGRWRPASACSTACSTSPRPGRKPTTGPSSSPQALSSGDCIQQSLLLAIYQARHHLVLTTLYFVPDDPLAAARSSAAARGVLVQLVLPARNDSLMANHASNSFMEDLLAAGVEIHRYDAGLLHTKSVLVDDDFALVGTVNLDRRSLWLNFEVTLLIDNPVFVAEMNQLVQGYMLEATPCP